MKKKKVLTLALLSTLLITTFSTDITSASTLIAPNYQFNNEHNIDFSTMFGKSTNTDVLIDRQVNVRLDQNSNLKPPPNGFYNGEYATDKQNQYYTDNGKAPLSTYQGNGSFANYDTSQNQLVNENNTNTNNTTNYYIDDNLDKDINIIPRYFTDDSIGKLTVPNHDVKNLSVYEGETLENMRKGLGHFENTSAWDGNVALCGHNRGSYAYLSFVKDMKIGEEITYKTPYGERTYVVKEKAKISSTDISGLSYSDDNRITLITCVINSPNERWQVVAYEK